MLNSCKKHRDLKPLFCLCDVILGQGEETDWPARWGAVSSGKIPKDIQWPQPALTWWGAHSVCRHSSPSPTLHPKPRPSWVTCPVSYQQPINVPTLKRRIQVRVWKQKGKKAWNGNKLEVWLEHCEKSSSLGCFKAPSGSASLSSSLLRQSALC